MTLTIYGSLEQGSTGWLEARAGVLTASTIGQLITAKTIKPAMNDRSRGLCQTLIAERITGHVEPVFPNRAMTRGTLLEPEARRIYAEQTGQDVDEVGFARLDTDTYTLGSSPDGLVGETGGIEIKSPSAKVHVATVLSGAIPDYNRAQVQAFLHVTGREWCDFISYYPGEPLFIIRDYPDKRWQAAIQSAAEQFEETARSAVARYERNTHGLPATEWWDPFDTGEEIY